MVGDFFLTTIKNKEVCNKAADYYLEALENVFD